MHCPIQNPAFINAHRYFNHIIPHVHFDSALFTSMHPWIIWFRLLIPLLLTHTLRPSFWALWCDVLVCNKYRICCVKIGHRKQNCEPIFACWPCIKCNEHLNTNYTRRKLFSYSFIDLIMKFDKICYHHTRTSHICTHTRIVVTIINF